MGCLEDECVDTVRDNRFREKFDLGHGRKLAQRRPNLAPEAFEDLCGLAMALLHSERTVQTPTRIDEYLRAATVAVFSQGQVFADGGLLFVKTFEHKPNTQRPSGEGTLLPVAC